MNHSIKNLCIYHVLDGLAEGLSHYSGPSRAALLYAEKPDDKIQVCDPQRLLEGHEPVLKKLYVTSDGWRREAPSTLNFKLFGQIYPERNLQLAGLISFGGRTQSMFYQMWFTEHHPDMCSIGPTERWLEHAVSLLAHDFANEDAFYTRNSRYVLREYATHAVRDFIRDDLNIKFGWDTSMEVYPILDTILGVSKTREEGAWPRGLLAFVEPDSLPEIHFLIRFPSLDILKVSNYKHVRKLLLAVENSDRKLVSDGRKIIGIASGELPQCRITADFRGGHGFLRFAGELVCSFSDGSFHSTTRKPNLVHLEELLVTSSLDPAVSSLLFKIVSCIVEAAGEQKHGCSLVIDFNDPPVRISGQQLERPVDLQHEQYLELAKSLAKVDGALHICSNLHLHGFACLLDGRFIKTEDRARGARFNSALRFTSENPNLIVVVVSSDRPVSVIQGGVLLNPPREWEPFSLFVTPPPTLEEWLRR